MTYDRSHLRAAWPAGEWLDRIAAGETYRTIANENGITRERVRQVVSAQPGFYEAKARGKRAKNAAWIARHSERTDRLVELRRAGKSVREIAAETATPVTVVSMLLSGAISNSEWRAMHPGGSARAHVFTREQMIAALREADAINHRERLHILDYEALRAAKPEWPSAIWIQKHFERWSIACDAAGIASNPGARGSRRDLINVDACLAAVEKCRAELGIEGVPSSTRYEKWSHGRKDVPSCATIRTRLHGWRGVIRALDPELKL